MHRRVALLLSMALLLAGCSAPPTGAPVVSIAPAVGGTQPPDIPLAADAEFREHIASAAVQLGSDLKVFAEDASVDSTSGKTEAAFFLQDTKAELAWLAAHPAATCYAKAQAGWKSIVAATQKVFQTYLAGLRAKSLASISGLAGKATAYTSSFSTSC